MNDDRVGRLASVIASRAAALFGLSHDDIGVDEPIVTGEGIRIGGVDLDSVDLVEILVTVEDEVGLDLLTDADLSAMTTLRALAAHVVAVASTEQVDGFLAGGSPKQ